MPDVLEEMTGEALARSQVEARIVDWERRIAALYALVDTWLPADWSSKSDRLVRMIEEPMREVELPPHNLPALDLLNEGKPTATLEPRGLWIIGANGRLDLKRGPSHYLIIDVAKNFDPPLWRLSSITDRRGQKPFERATLQAVLLSV